MDWRGNRVEQVKLPHLTDVKYRGTSFVVNVEGIDAIRCLAGSVLCKCRAGLFVNRLRPCVGALELQAVSQPLDQANLERVVPGMGAIGKEIHGPKVLVCPRAEANR